MKIVEPVVTLVHATGEPERVIERMGRICYQSNHKVKQCKLCRGTGFFDEDPHHLCMTCNKTGTDIASAIAFVNMIKQNGHESVLEHAVAGFSIVTDRGVTHEIVRHRLASYSQESTRYCNYSKDQFGGELTFIQPPDLQGKFEEWEAAMLSVEKTYAFLLTHGCAPQIARGVLPNSLKSEIGMTANFREWRHFLRLRTAPKAHPQMRQIAEMLRFELLKVSKVCFEDIP
jgi:thymidylate synthase (FAD)